jgi:hypothetical protein
MAKLHFIALTTIDMLLVVAQDLSNKKIYNFNVIPNYNTWQFDNTNNNDSGLMQTDIIDRNYMYGEFNLQNWDEHLRPETMYDLIENTFYPFDTIENIVNGGTDYEGEERIEILQELLKLQLSL